MTKPKRNKFGEFIFKDYPDFMPNLSPSEIFQLGSFGGTYWRNIKSKVTGEEYIGEDIYKSYPSKWWSGLNTKNKNWLTLDWDKYDKKINKYGVKVGQTLEDWEKKKWITNCHPYGWIHWYCDFFVGKRCSDDKRQIDRWNRSAGKKGRFRKWLITLIFEKNGKWNDHLISPKIRQTLQHWGYKLTENDYNNEIKIRSNN